MLIALKNQTHGNSSYKKQIKKKKKKKKTGNVQFKQKFA